MIELGYFALGFVLGIVFTFVSLLSVGRWLRHASGIPTPDCEPTGMPETPRRKTTGTMWDK